MRKMFLEGKQLKVNMDNNLMRDEEFTEVGIPYDDINWYDIQGQPFGVASQFNAIIFEDANNIVDTKGAMAVGGNFSSPRGLTLGYGNDVKLTGTGYSPDLVRFLVGQNVSMNGPLVVVGHVLSGGNFRAASGSTYLIGKDNMSTQEQELEYLYQAKGGSPYWKPSDKGDHYLISSYDVPRYIPASRLKVDVPLFFEDARDSITVFKNCIVDLEVNGTVVDNFHELVLRGNDPKQNVFFIDVSPTGVLKKGIRAEVPEGSLIIVKFRTGRNAHLQYGLLGDERHANRTLYVFEDARDIFMEVPAAIWGSILAPEAMFHAHSTGGHVSGNAAFRSFAVHATSGFEFHLYPFVGGITCGEVLAAPIEVAPAPEVVPAPEVAPTPEVAPITECPEQMPCPVCPKPEVCPEQKPCPEQMPCPKQKPCPEQKPCQECPKPETCPEQRPCPKCPKPEVCPEQRPCPKCPKPEVCPEQRPCPKCSKPEAYPEQRPCPKCSKSKPCPKQMPCSTCPKPEACPEQMLCPECMIKPGLIFGCIWGCSCCRRHEWEVRLYRICGEKQDLLYCKVVEYCGCFEFEVPYEGYYLLKVCPARYYRKKTMCKPILSLKNVGVSNFTIQ